jgi:hypothetical protein
MGQLEPGYRFVTLVVVFVGVEGDVVDVCIRCWGCLLKLFAQVPGFLLFFGVTPPVSI